MPRLVYDETPGSGLDRGRRTSTRRPPSVTDPSSWPWRTATRSVHDVVDLHFHQLGQYAERDADVEREQTLPRGLDRLDDRSPDGEIDLPSVPTR
jgi:hypothetical protein